MMRNIATLLLAGSFLSACSLAPDFAVPEQALPEKFKQQADSESESAKESEAKAAWKEAAPIEKEERGEWWKIFADEALNNLEKQAVQENQSLKAAAARVEQARALASSNAAGILPDIDIGANAVRARSADDSTASVNGKKTSKLKPYNLYSANVVASYELDLFSRAHDAENAFNLDADAQEAIYKSVLLALQADVAQTYFQLRGLDSERGLLKETVKTRTEALRIMQKRYDVGSVGEADLSRSKSELAEAKADFINLNRQRAGLENLLAVLLGKNPSEYSFAETPLENTLPPPVPAGIPSGVMQHRPDIAAAISGMAAANQRIGVARTAFFPSLVLTATGGTQSTALADIFKWSSRTWAIGQTAGSALAMNIFESGRSLGQLDLAHAAYDESVANYKQQVLTAMGEVENALSTQSLLASQATEQEAAASATTRTYGLTMKRYEKGDANYFEVVDAQRTMLAANRAAIQTRSNRLLATIGLIRALGGSWG